MGCCSGGGCCQGLWAPNKCRPLILSAPSAPTSCARRPACVRRQRLPVGPAAAPDLLPPTSRADLLCVWPAATSSSGCVPRASQGTSGPGTVRRLQHVCPPACSAVQWVGKYLLRSRALLARTPKPCKRRGVGGVRWVGTARDHLARYASCSVRTWWQARHATTAGV